MIPLSLTLQNFMSYRERTTVELAGVRMACLSGDNGAGKSALLDAMTWAVWGKTRADSDRHVITIGESEMEVTFTFQLGQHEYRVFRRRTIRGQGRGRPTLEFDMRDAGGESWQTATGDSVRDTEDRIAGTIRMDYETFVNSAFLMQGQADTFTSKKPDQRKKVLADILNLDDYDELASMARDREKTTRNKMHHLRERVTQIDQQIEERPATRQRIEQLQTQLDESQARYQCIQNELNSLSVQIESMSHINQLRDNARERRSRCNRQLSEVQQRIAQDTREREKLGTLLQRADEIENGAAQLEHWNSVNQACAATLQKRQPLSQQKQEAQQEIDRQANELQRQIDRAASNEQTSRRQLDQLTAQREELKKLKAQSVEAREELLRLEQLQQQRRQLESEQAECSAANQRLKTDMEDIQQKMQALQDGQATCPICRRPLDEGEHEHIAEEWKTEGTQLGQRYRDNRARIQEIAGQIKELDQNISTLEKTRDSEAGRASVIQRLEREVGEYEAIEKQVNDASSEHQRLLTVQKQADFAHQARESLAQAEAALAELPYDPDEHSRAQEQIKAFAQFEKELRDLEHARLNYEAISQRIAESGDRQREIEAEINQIDQEIASHDQQLKDEASVRDRYNTAKSEAGQVEQHRNSLHSDLGAARKHLETLDRMAEEREELTGQVNELAGESDGFKELNVAFGRRGIQAMVIENVLPELEDEANALLRKMSTGHLHVGFHTTREAVSNDNVIETLDIIIKDEYGERPYAMYSGGEAFRVDFAIRIALSKLLARRAGATIDMLVIDEGFGTQDSRGRDGLVEALRSIESDFGTVLVITHIDEIRDQFPTRIDVVKTADGSCVSVN